MFKIPLTEKFWGSISAKMDINNNSNENVLGNEKGKDREKIKNKMGWVWMVIK